MARHYPGAIAPVQDALVAFVHDTARADALDDLARWTRTQRASDVGDREHALDAALEVRARYVAATDAPRTRLRETAERVATGQYYGYESAYQLLAASDGFA